MANPEHLAKLKEEVKPWAQWRKENPDVRPDLSDANLSNADLSDANLGNLDLLMASLTGANLSNANLKGADSEGPTSG